MPITVIDHYHEYTHGQEKIFAGRYDSLRIHYKLIILFTDD
jgi:hypothetical protein